MVGPWHPASIARPVHVLDRNIALFVLLIVPPFHSPHPQFPSSTADFANTYALLLGLRVRAATTTAKFESELRQMAFAPAIPLLEPHWISRATFVTGYSHGFTCEVARSQPAPRPLRTSFFLLPEIGTSRSARYFHLGPAAAAALNRHILDASPPSACRRRDKCTQPSLGYACTGYNHGRLHSAHSNSAARARTAIACAARTRPAIACRIRAARTRTAVACRTCGARTRTADACAARARCRISAGIVNYFFVGGIVVGFNLVHAPAQVDVVSRWLGSDVAGRGGDVYGWQPRPSLGSAATAVGTHSRKLRCV